MLAACAVACAAGFAGAGACAGGVACFAGSGSAGACAAGGDSAGIADSQQGY